MSSSKTAPYGSWKSPITSDLIVAETIGLGQAAIHDDLYWLELRPQEEGRLVLVRCNADGERVDLTPHGFNVRTRVHEYGGGAYAVSNRTVYFSNYADQRVYRLDGDGHPRPITPEAAFRYADFTVDAQRNLLFCVREDHTGSDEAVNTLVTVSCDGDDAGGAVIVSGNDFYSSPRLSPDGTQLAWLTWNHPNMPWDGTELWVGEFLEDGSLGKAQRVAGGVDESIFQPQWSPDGVLYFVSDRTGWWNLVRLHAGDAEALSPLEAEFGYPQWIFGLSTYAFESPERIICSYSSQGSWRLASLDTRTLALEEIETPYTDIGSIHAVPGRVLFRGGSPSEPESIVLLTMATGKHEVIRRSSDLQLDAGYLSIPESIEFPTEDGKIAHAFFYPPYNRDYAPPEDQRPPVLVLSHGGPTSASTTELNLEIQYWTSRGFAVLDVNYGGSTGYGRNYRQRLNGRWGIVDVDDCINAARYLVDRGDVDGNRLAIAGGSAGGYTTLSVLTFRDEFHVGASHFGVADLEALATDTHKFESRYLDTLVGPYPEERARYLERSPIHHVDRLNCPLILFQGLEDKVVLPDQAEKMFEAVRAKGLPVSYLPFEGEQHGFRKAENIKRALDAELYFYSKVFEFDLADPIEPVPIENL